MNETFWMYTNVWAKSAFSRVFFVLFRDRMQMNVLKSNE